MSLQKQQSKSKNFQKKIDVSTTNDLLKLHNIIYDSELNFLQFVILNYLEQGATINRRDLVRVLKRYHFKLIYVCVEKLVRLGYCDVRGYKSNIEITYKGRIYIDKIYNILFVS